MSKTNEKVLDGFYSFEAKEVQDKLKAQKEREFPNFNTVAEGKGKILRKIRWAKFTRNESLFEIPVLAVEQNGEIREVTLSALYGKEFEFILASNGNKKKVDNLLAFEIGMPISARNEKLMALIPADGIDVNFGFLEGHYNNGKNSRNFRLLTISL